MSRRLDIGAKRSLIPPDLLLDVLNQAARLELPRWPEVQEPPEFVEAGSWLCGPSSCLQIDAYLDLLAGLNHLLSCGP